MVGVAVIGLRAIGRFHAGLAERVARELGVRASAAAAEAFADPDVSAVVIAAPTPLHAGLIEAAAAAGVHVFCEKPLGVELGPVQQAVRAARGAGVHIQVGFQRRFDREFVSAKRRIDSGEVGAIRLLRIAHRNRTPPHPGELTGRLGSIFVDMTVHDLDTARWLVGDIAEVHSFQQRRNTVTVLRFRAGALGVIDNSRHAGYGFECSAEILGAGSAVRLGVGVQAEDNIERHEPAYRDELREFVACVANGHDPAVNGEDALEALGLALAAERSVA